MTRRAGWGAVVAVTAILAGCAPGGPPVTPPGSPVPTSPAPGTATTPSLSPTASATPSLGPTAAPDACSALVASMTLPQQAGQLVMLGVFGDPSADERAAIEKYAFGSVILEGNSTAGVAGTRKRTDAIAALGGPAGILVAADQEGGTVQRLKGSGFDTIPSAVDQAKLGDALRARAARWGSQLADAGVRLNFAPVADVVPASKTATNEPIGKLRRGYGSTPEQVSAHIVPFIEGMHDAGVGTSAKHFPNLGQATGNTDFTADVVDTVTTADDPALGTYRAALGAGVDTVMVSTAIYRRIDPDAVGALSPTVVGILRDDLGFDGVVVSDDLGAAEAVASIPAADRATRFVRAGGDLAISRDVAPASAMVTGLAQAAESDPALARRVAESALRVVRLKQHLGVTGCG